MTVNANESMTEEEAYKAKLMDAIEVEMKQRILAGAFTSELQQELAQTLLDHSGEIVRRGVAQNAKIAVVSPWTVVCFTGRKARLGASILVAKVKAAKAKRAAAQAVFDRNAEIEPDVDPAAAVA